MGKCTNSRYRVSSVASCKNWPSQVKEHVLRIHGITGNIMETKGQITLCIGETFPREFLVVENLPMDCEVLLGQDWLVRFGYCFQIPA